jgi:hypothetical protein
LIASFATGNEVIETNQWFSIESPNIYKEFGESGLILEILLRDKGTYYYLNKKELFEKIVDVLDEDDEIGKALLINYEYLLYEAVENEKIMNYLLYKIKTLTRKQRETFLQSPENFSTFLFADLNSSTKYTRIVLDKYPEIAKNTLFFLSLENDIADIERLSKSVYKYHDVYDDNHFGAYAMEFFYPSCDEDFKITDFYYKIYKTFDEETAINLIHINQEDIERLVKEENVSIKKLENKLYSLQRLTKTEMESIYPYTDILFTILLWDNGTNVLKNYPLIPKELYDNYSKNDTVIDAFRYTIEDLGNTAVFFYSQNKGNLNIIELMGKKEYHKKYGSTHLISKIMDDLVTLQYSKGTKLMDDRIIYYLKAPFEQVFSEKYSVSSLSIIDFIPGIDLFNLIYKASNGYILDSWDYIGAGMDTAELIGIVVTVGASKVFSAALKTGSKKVVKKTAKETSETAIQKLLKKADDVLPAIKKIKSSKFVLSSKGKMISFYKTIKNFGKIDVTEFYELCFKLSKKISSKIKLLQPLHKKIYLASGRLDARSVMRANLVIKFDAPNYLVKETMVPFMIGKSVELNCYLVAKIVKKGMNSWD